METWKLLALIAVVSAVVCYVRGSSVSDGEESWSAESWQTEPSETSFTSKVADLIKRSKSQQFYGLMGRRSGIQVPARQGRKRNKGEMFVGLMGRRSSSGELQEEWDKPQFYDYP
ncbi:protachykinin-1 [Brienomyrus brachyistius]|uniref:protachykinin-1 n=1 Tax=Brienomyrus brachyistius TaxID=42636 RepID=UPI0020B25B98|nr:protachykinin-1 [Brienomyrus brachyistius]